MMNNTIIIGENKKVTINSDTHELVKVLTTAFDEAVAHRSSCGVDAKLIKGYMQAMSKYDPCVKGNFEKKQEPDVFFPLGAMKARTQVSWVKGTVTASIEKMWEVEPTPIPELPEDITAEITNEVLAELSEVIGSDSILQFSDLVEIVNNLVDEQVDRQYEIAKQRADRMSRLILDQWVEGGWLETWSEVVSDLAKSPIAVVKGPIEVTKRTVKWRNGKLKEVEQVKPIIYRIAPENFYPMPDVTHDVNSGTGIFELSTMSKADLYTASKNSNYNQSVIDNLLKNSPNGWEVTNTNSRELAKLLNRVDDNNDVALGKGVYHTVKYYGRIQVKYLKQDEVIKGLPKSLTDDDYVNIEAWVVKDSLIYLKLEPYPLGKRPFSVIPREFVSGSIWGGESLQSMIETPQRIVNALVRQHILNMGYAAGPIGEAEASRFPGPIPSYIEPRKVYMVNPSNHGERALRFTDIPSRTNDYITTMQFYLAQADTLSGIPGYIEGTPGREYSSSLGQTEFYYGNASRGIDSLLDNIDDYLIEPLLNRFYYRNLLSINDDSIKGDVKWKARGLSGVFAKQNSQNKSLAALQLLGNLREVMPSYVTEDKFLQLVKPVFENVGIDITEVLPENTVSPPTRSDIVEQVSQSIDVAPTPPQVNTES